MTMNSQGSSNFSAAKAVKLMASLLAALELNLLQQNTVKLAAILLQRNWSIKQLFCYSEKQSSKQQYRLQRTFLSQFDLALMAIAHKKMTFNVTITSFRRHLRKKFHVGGNVCHHFFIILFLLFFFLFRLAVIDDECCNRTFLDHILPTLWKMLPIFTVSSGCECYGEKKLMPQTRLFYPTHNIA